MYLKYYVEKNHALKPVFIHALNIDIVFKLSYTIDFVQHKKYNTILCNMKT